MPSAHLRKRSESSWTVVLELGYDPLTKRRIRRERAVRGSRRDAERVLQAMLREAEGGADLDAEAGRMTVGALAERWLAHVSAHRKAATVTYYRTCLRLALPALAELRIERLRPGHLQACIDDLARRGDLSPTTIRHVAAALHAMLEFGQRMRYLGQNPARGLTLPKPVERRPDVLTEEQVERILEAERGTRWHVVFWLAARCGLRVGEIVALQWRDVDWRRKRLLVERSMQRSGQIGPTKSGRSRAVDLGAADLAMLRDWQRAQAQERLRSPRWQHPELVVTGEHGRPLHLSSPTHELLKVCRCLGLPPASIHDLRHTHGSILLAHGWDIATVSERLGHSSPAFTAKVYLHELPGRQRAYVDRGEDGRQMGGIEPV